MEIDIILEADVTPARVAELAAIAESYGIRGLWTQNYANARDAFMCLMPAATATKKIMLGAVVPAGGEGDAFAVFPQKF